MSSTKKALAGLGRSPESGQLDSAVPFLEAAHLDVAALAFGLERLHHGQRRRHGREVRDVGEQCLAPERIAVADLFGARASCSPPARCVLARIASTTCGDPSPTFLSTSAGICARSSALAVPSVATMVNPAP